MCLLKFYNKKKKKKKGKKTNGMKLVQSGKRSYYVKLRYTNHAWLICL